MNLVKILVFNLFFILLSLGSTVQAEEKTEETTAEASEEESSEEGEPKKVEKHPDAERWVRHNSKMQVYQSRMQTAEKRLAELIQMKNSGKKFIKDEKKGNVPILDVIVQTHDDLEKATGKYNKERQTLLYRFPGGKDLILRKYVPTRSPSIEQVEKELGLDGALTELKRKIDKKYSFATGGPKVALPQKKDEPESTLTTREEEEAEKKKKKLRLAK